MLFPRLASMFILNRKICFKFSFTNKWAFYYFQSSLLAHIIFSKSIPPLAQFLFKTCCGGQLYGGSQYGRSCCICKFAFLNFYLFIINYITLTITDFRNGIINMRKKSTRWLIVIQTFIYLINSGKEISHSIGLVSHGHMKLWTKGIHVLIDSRFFNGK